MRVRKRRRVIAISVLAAVVLLLGSVSTAVYVFPQTDTPRASDVIFVIGPPDDSRLALATSLAESGLSSNIMVTVGPWTPSTHALYRMCNNEHSFTVYCETPSPLTTQGEARWLADMSREHGWTSATVITFTPHISRARIIIERCYSGDLAMVADPDANLSPFAWGQQFVYQTGAFVKVLVQPGC